MSAIIRNDVETAEQFLGALAPDSSLWDGRSRDWIFRGVDDIQHRLIASAYRDPPPCLYVAGALHDASTNPHATLQVEVDVLETFLSIANDAGLSTAHGADFCVRKQGATQIRRLRMDDPDKWPPAELIAALALAQHHGIPTRMLDWTRRSFIAAYFAVYQLAECLRTPCHVAATSKRFCVWALDYRLLEHISTPEFTLQSGCPRFEIVSVPRVDNENLHAQDGIFLLDRGYLMNQAALDVLAEQHQHQKLLICVSAPISEAPKVLRMLAYDHRIGSATLFPGYRGVARQAREQWYWDLHPDHVSCLDLAPNP